MAETTAMGLLDQAQFAESVLTGLAVVIGGAWAYFRFFRGRVFAARIDLDISGTWDSTAGRHRLHVRVGARNIGAARLRIHRDATALIVHLPKPREATGADPVTWRRVLVLDVLGPHVSIESGESIDDEVLIDFGELGEDDVLLEIWVAAARTFGRKAHGVRRRIVLAGARRTDA